MRLRHQSLHRLLSSPAGPPFDRATRRLVSAQLWLYGALSLHAALAAAAGSLIGGLPLSLAVCALCASGAAVAWRSRLAYAQLMMPIGCLHLLLTLLHLLPMAKQRARLRFGLRDLALPAVMHAVALVLAFLGTRKVAAAMRASAGARRRAPPAPFMRPLQCAAASTLMPAGPSASGISWRGRDGLDSASLSETGMISAPPLLPLSTKEQ